ncbi:MAG: DEAD/DEAH box helicase, partial [Eggerthella lenta]
MLITSYDLLRIDAEDFARREFYCCALDEAQYVKNHATKTARAAKRVRARHRFALTGTPMENRLSELWSIFDFLMPGLLGSYMRFREHFELDITGGDEDAARRLRSLVAPFMLRRLKADVLQDLPDKLESVVYVPMEAEQQRLYAAHEQQLRDALTLQKNNRNNKRFH